MNKNTQIEETSSILKSRLGNVHRLVNVTFKSHVSLFKAIHWNETGRVIVNQQGALLCTLSSVLQNVDRISGSDVTAAFFLETRASQTGHLKTDVSIGCSALSRH